MEALTKEHFFKLKVTPIPEHMKDLTIKHDNGPSWRFVHQDWGFVEHPSDYVERAKAGDPEAQLLCKRALRLFHGLMERDVASFDKLNEVDGSFQRNADGEKVQERRTKWREAPGVHARINQGNARLPLDFWFQYVEHNWYEVLANLRWFDPTPSSDPEDPHTQILIDRKLNKMNPQRRVAREYCYENGLIPFGDTEEDYPEKFKPVKLESVKDEAEAEDEPEESELAKKYPAVTASK